MIRSASSFLIQSSIRRVNHNTSPALSLVRRIHLTSSASSSLFHASKRSSLDLAAQFRYQACPAVIARTLSSDSGSDTKKSEQPKNEKTDADADGETTKEIVMTPGEKVVAAGRLSMWAGVGVFALCCAYYIGVELFPTKMSPNRVFDRSFDLIRQDAEITRRYGESVKGYGRDHGGHREGRRNFVEHTKYKNEEDGSQRTRVRYNLEGRFGTAFVFAEVSNQMPSGEFVYILVQDKSNGRVHTVVDNRASLTAQRLASGSAEAQSAMAQLLAGGKK